MRRARANHSIAPDYREMLLDKKREVIASLGAKYQAVAHSGRMSEEDQAQFSIDEFITLRLNHLDYQQNLSCQSPSARQATRTPDGPLR